MTKFGAKFQVFSIVFLLTTLVVTSPVFAQPTTESGNYSLEEVFVGPGGTTDSSSTNFSAQGSLGDIGVGESASANFNLLAGYTTDAQPTILFAVNGGVVDLGVISTITTGTGTATFSVGAYNAQGVIVQTVSQPPTNDSATLDPMTTTAASAQGTEQFGINLVANTSPTTFGANPVQIPDSTFSFATVATGYDTPNQFRYNVGEIVAESNQSTGQTDFTMSYIANAGPITEGGEFSMNHVLVATATY